MCYNSAAIVNKVLVAVGYGDPFIHYSTYWSSTEHSSNGGIQSVGVFFGDGSHVSLNKNSSGPVRAVRIHNL